MFGVAGDTLAALQGHSNTLATSPSRLRPTTRPVLPQAERWKISKNQGFLEKSLDFMNFSAYFHFFKNVLGVAWGIRGKRTRAGMPPEGLLGRLRRPQAAVDGVAVCG